MASFQLNPHAMEFIMVKAEPTLTNNHYQTHQPLRTPLPVQDARLLEFYDCSRPTRSGTHFQSNAKMVSCNARPFLNSSSKASPSCPVPLEKEYSSKQSRQISQKKKAITTASTINGNQRDINTAEQYEEEMSFPSGSKKAKRKYTPLRVDYRVTEENGYRARGNAHQSQNKVQNNDNRKNAHQKQKNGSKRSLDDKKHISKNKPKIDSDHHPVLQNTPLHYSNKVPHVQREKKGKKTAKSHSSLENVIMESNLFTADDFPSLLSSKASKVEMEKKELNSKIAERENKGQEKQVAVVEEVVTGPRARENKTVVFEKKKRRVVSEETLRWRRLLDSLAVSAVILAVMKKQNEEEAEVLRQRGVQRGRIPGPPSDFIPLVEYWEHVPFAPLLPGETLKDMVERESKAFLEMAS